jgi:glycosyltransferase involved in cell wall biosynthesis
VKILFYTPVNIRSGGGCERWHCDITNSLRKLGVDVEIVSGNLDEGTLKWSKDELVKELNRILYTCLYYINLFGVLIPTPRTISILYKNFSNVDYVHFIYGFMGQDILVLLLKIITGKKVIVGHHAPTLHSGKIHNFYMKYVSRYLMNLFDAHITLNKRDKQFFEQNWHIKNVHFIPSGVNVEKFLNKEKMKHEGLHFITVGRLEKQKGIDLMLLAIELFNKKFPNSNAVFHIVGNGFYKDMVEKFTSTHSNIIYHGYVNNDELVDLYAQCDVYLLPSREEPFGLVLIEAWSSGLPILATRTEGPSDMLVEGLNGWFIDAIDSVEEIFKGIESIYETYHNNVESLILMEKNCRSTGTKYSIDNMAKKIVEVFTYV